MSGQFDSDGQATRAIKAALRKAFPGTRFAVTRGGSCIEWTDDGPTVEQVGDALLAANCVVQESSWNGERLLKVPSNHHTNSIWFDRYNVAERAAAEADRARRAVESEQQRRRESEAVAAASVARTAALARPPGPPPAIESAPEAFKAFDELAARAERDTRPDDEAERKRRPSWGAPLIIQGELLDACIELGRLQPGDKPLVRLWAQFADPKQRGIALREQRSAYPLIGFECRGFELHTGTERGSSGDILFEAQRGEAGAWRFGPRASTFEYRSPRGNKWGSLVAERERVASGYWNYAPDVASANLARIAKDIAEIEAQDHAAAKAFYRRQHLRNRIAELGRDRVLDFAGAPGLQMAMAARLSGNCFNCGRALTDPISLERGIGPECIVHKIANIWINRDLACDNAANAFSTGMPEDFVAATLKDPRPLYREPLDYFPIAHFSDGRVRVYRRDGPGVIGTFDNLEAAQAWIATATMMPEVSQ